MPKYTTHFELNVDDIELIENALRQIIKTVGSNQTKREAHALLGKLHNQKRWYEPKEKNVPRG